MNNFQKKLMLSMVIFSDVSLNEDRLEQLDSDMHAREGFLIYNYQNKPWGPMVGGGAKLVLNVCPLHMLWLAMKSEGLLFF